jgi:hypothetical protein
MTADDYVWDYRSGRDEDGSAYYTNILVHGSGRILAKVVTCSYFYRAQFHFSCPKTVLDVNECYDFMDVLSAKRFIEETLARFDPLAPPKPKAARKREKVTA